MLLLDRQDRPAEAGRASPATDERRLTAIVLAAAVVLTLALRLPYVHIPLGVDEGGVAFIAKAWGSGHGSIYGAYWLDRPPLLVALYKVAVLGGVTGIRALAALAAAALVVATTLCTRAVAGDRAARIAALLSAVLASSVALRAVFAPAELLAAGPAAASVGCLVLAHRRGRAGWLLAAGLLAISAALVKQSFLDAGFAGAVFLVATAIRDRRLPWRSALAYAAGVALPLIAVGGWLALAHVRAGSLVYALAGFRVQGLNTLAGSSVPLLTRLHTLYLPGALSGIFVVGLIALAGFPALRGDRVLVATLVAWLAGCMIGVLGGGSYWPHYLIQLIAPTSLLAAAALRRLPTPARIAIPTAIAALSVAATVGGLSLSSVTKQQTVVLHVARYVRAHARPGDTQYVMYARANLGYYIGLPSPYPYAWSLMVRTIPSAPGRLARLLESPRRPTWVVRWQHPHIWHLDPHGATAHALYRHYRRVTTISGRAIYHERSAR